MLHNISLSSTRNTVPFTYHSLDDMSLTEIPEEVLELIFSFLQPNENTWFNVLQTCKKFNRILFRMNRINGLYNIHRCENI